MIASIYVPNGGKDFEAKMRFLDALDSFVADAQQNQKLVVLCGDLNVALTERDIHPKERKPGVIGQRPEERALFDRLLGAGLVDVPPPHPKQNTATIVVAVIHVPIAATLTRPTPRGNAIYPPENRSGTGPKF